MYLAGTYLGATYYGGVEQGAAAPVYGEAWISIVNRLLAKITIS